MPGSDNTEQRRRRGTRPGTLRSLSRYDLVLAFLPTVFLVGLVVGSFLSVDTQTTLVGAAVIGVVALVDALFLNPPSGTGRA